AHEHLRVRALARVPEARVTGCRPGAVDRRVVQAIAVVVAVDRRVVSNRAPRQSDDAAVRAAKIVIDGLWGGSPDPDVDLAVAIEVTRRDILVGRDAPRRR